MLSKLESRKECMEQIELIQHWNYFCSLAERLDDTKHYIDHGLQEHDGIRELVHGKVYSDIFKQIIVLAEFEEYTTNTYSKGASAWKNWAEKIESGEMEGKDAIVAFYEKQLAEAKLEVMALEQRLEAIKNDEPAIFPVTAEEIEDINDAYVEYFGDKYGKQTDNHRYADVYIGQMLWAFLTQENF